MKKRRHHIVRSLRERLELTQAEFGDPIGLSAVRVCQIEKSEGIAGETALRILDEYRREMAGAGISLEDLIRNSAA